jgi:hypothetical protein
VSQTRIKRRIKDFDVVEFSEESTTERGEKVYQNMEVTFHPFGLSSIKRVISCDKGIGITAEWIEDTIQGCLEALHKDYPQDVFKVVRHQPNQVSFEYVGARGVVN